MHDVFLSYSRRNSRIVQRLVADLEDHGLDVWLDTLELEIGDAVHRTIEDAIVNSRFFCLAISPASMRSYYVREVEFEQAFSRMVSEQRTGYILPIMVQAYRDPLPPRLANIFRLDFTKRNKYTENVKSIVHKVRGVDRNYSGARWFKGLNISNLGEPVGVGPIAQKASLGPCYRIQWTGGMVDRVDVFSNGQLVHYKEFDYDEQGRVIANKMYSPDDRGGWLIRDDVWYYTYDPVTGSRRTKTMRYLGEATARVVHYDPSGRALFEEVVTDRGKQPDRSFPYARKVFEYDVDGNSLGERWYDAGGAEIPPR